MKREITKGATSQSIDIFIQDSSSTVGAGLTGLAYNSASLTCYYHRPGATATAVTLATQTVTGAYSSGGFVEIDATNMPGFYRLDIPDAALATGVDFITMTLKGATNMATLPLEISLVAFNPQSATDLGLSSISGIKTKTDFLPSATAGAAGGVFIAGTNAATSITTALTANITGNLSGSVGSVTGSVGSVTGNVGGNVVGSVASVTATVSADMVSISGDTVAADNLEAMLDGTGGVDVNIRQLISTCADALPNIVLAGSGTSDGIAFTRTGSGNPFDANFAAQIQSEAMDALNAYGPPTKTEMEARTIVSANYALEATLTAMKGATFDTATDSLEALRNRGDAAWITATTLDAAGVRSAVGLASANLDTQLDALPTATENADALLNRDMSAVSDTNARSPLNALRAVRNKTSISGSTLTVTKEDDATSAWTASVTTDAAADPITGVDPA